MTKSEIEKLHKSIATDFKIVTRKTELWKMEECYNYLHDIKKFMIFQYVEKISLVMVINGAATKAKKYLITNTVYQEDHRPGDIDWEEDEDNNLTVVLTFSSSYLELSREQQLVFLSDLKITWGATDINLDFPHLLSNLSKVYSAGNNELHRIDYK